MRLETCAPVAEDLAAGEKAITCDQRTIQTENNAGIMTTLHHQFLADNAEHADLQVP